METIAYTVAVTFADRALGDEWVRWLQTGHVAEVLAGGATRAEIVAIDGGLSYEVRYEFPSREAFDRYEAEYAPRLRAEGIRLFPLEKGVAYRRTVGRVVLSQLRSD